MDGSKKTVIMEAADEMFSQKNTVVTIRTPLDTDVEVGKVMPAPKCKPNTPTTPPTTLVATESTVSQEEIETVEETKNETKPQKETTHSEERYESDQSKMIKDLFDGKYIN